MEAPPPYKALVVSEQPENAKSTIIKKRAADFILNSKCCSLIGKLTIGYLANEKVQPELSVPAMLL